MSADRHRYCTKCQLITPGLFCGKCGAALSEEPRVLGGRYVLLGPELGQGGMGRVVAGFVPTVHRKVAIKLLHTHLTRDLDIGRRFFYEATITGQLQHPSIVQVIDAQRTQEGECYIVMELLVGQSLAAVLTEKGKLDPVRALRLWRQVVSALATVHQHAPPIIHRDLKPENIFLTVEQGEDGPEERAKVLDFGIAKLADVQRTTQGAVMGTFWYMAPEQMAAQPVDTRADVYALGLLLYQLLSGQLPWPGFPATASATLRLHRDPLPLQEVCKGLRLPPPLLALMNELLARAPVQRPAHAGIVAQRIKEILQSHPPASWTVGDGSGFIDDPTVVFPPPGGPEETAPPPPPPPRAPLLPLLAGVALLGLLGLFGWLPRTCEPPPLPQKFDMTSDLTKVDMRSDMRSDMTDIITEPVTIDLYFVPDSPRVTPITITCKYEGRPILKMKPPGWARRLHPATICTAIAPGFTPETFEVGKVKTTRKPITLKPVRRER